MIHDEAEKLARELRPEDFQPPDKLLNYVSVEEMRVLCDYILSGDMRREIANAAFETAAQQLDEFPQEAERNGLPPRPDRYLAYKNAATITRSLIQPPAQKEEKK